ncbi:MAG: geranylgeranylglycerol-phosphate geranylgeranyltransferase [Candidatus Methanomethylophilaceae archaeon]|nr:geranylgeranylglycerol-phosphate geranylgeranyltransferase [Candidatus Methanomethylophilaceae archaeon]
MNRFLQLFRLGNCVMGIVGLLVAAFIASGTNMPDSWFQLLVASISVAGFIAAGNALNDYVDREVDRLAHPDRPLPSGRMEPRTALYVASGLFVSSLAISLLLDPISIAIFVIATVMMLAYELKLKASGLAGNATIALLTGGLFLLGGAVVGSVENTLAVAGMAMLVSLGREITKDIEDMEGDQGRNTLPMRIGKKNAGIIAAVFFISGPILSLQPAIDGIFGVAYLPLVLVADAIFLYDSWLLFQDPRRAQKLAKLGMLVALVAFIAGGFR